MPVIIDGTLGVNAAAITTTNWTPTNITTSGNTTLGDASGDTVTINAGNTTFTSTGARILGDFSNATLSNRVSFQSNVTNGFTYIHALPNGTGSNAGFSAFGGSDPTNAAFADISNNGAEGRLRSSATGTATTLPLALYVGTTRAMQITANGGSVSIGSTASNGSPSLQVWQGYNNYGIEVMAATSGTNSGVASFRLLNSANTVERLGLYGESDTVSSVRAQSNLLLNTGGIERVRIDSTGRVGIGKSPLSTLDVAGTIQAVHSLSEALAMRIVADGTNTKGALQFTNNAVNSDWAYLEAKNATHTTWRVSSGSDVNTGNALFGINGGPVGIRDITSGGGEASDWPVPSLSIASYDDYTVNTMLAFLLKDDTNYMTDTSKWNFRLYHGAGATTSDSSVSLQLGGPGNLYLSANGAGGIQFTTNGVERVRIPNNASGIQFPAAQVASTNPNTLDDYEEGNWTPTNVLDQNNNATTWYNGGGSYIKIGRLVYLKFRVLVSSAQSEVKIYGLPFASDDGDTGNGTSLCTRVNTNHTVVINADHIWVQGTNDYDYIYGMVMYRASA